MPLGGDVMARHIIVGAVNDRDRTLNVDIQSWPAEEEEQLIERAISWG